MSISLLLLITLGAGVAAYILATRKSRQALAINGPNSLHSLPTYYGFYALIWAVLPPILLMIVWRAIQAPVIEAQVMGGLPAATAALTDDRLGLLWTEIQNAARGGIV
ncbi:MAG: phosphate ABC transporter permease family protein, partial [Pseudomonadota bacterium]